MPIPELTPDGWLPPGVHRCSLDEVQETFAGALASEKRRRIMQALRDHCHNDTVLQYAAHVLVDGSFTSFKDEPDDADIVVGLRRGATRDILTDRLVSSKWVFHVLEGGTSPRENGEHLIHGFAGDLGDAKYNYFRGYFQKSDRDHEPEQKGVLLITVGEQAAL